MYPFSQPVNPATGQPYPIPPGLVYPGHPLPQHSGHPFPQGLPVTHSPYTGMPGPTSWPFNPHTVIEWVPVHTRDAGMLTGRAVVGGYEDHDGSPLWVIRAHYKGDLIPGKLAILRHAAYVPYGGDEHSVKDIEVCCALAEKVHWFPSSEGRAPPNAVVGGKTSDGELLYIGRVKHEKSLTPGKVHPSQGVLFISFAGKEKSYKKYEVLCVI